MRNRLIPGGANRAGERFCCLGRTAHDGLVPPLIVDSQKPNAKTRGSRKSKRTSQAFLQDDVHSMKKASNMAKVDIGTKRVCPECEAKFYDLTRNPAVCPMCQHSFDPSELDPNVVLPSAPLKPQTSKNDDDDDDIEDAVEVDEDDIDEEEQAAKELELDGDDAAIISGGAGDDDGETPDFDGYSTDEDEDQDAALVADDEDTLPPGAADDDDEEIEI